MENTADRAIAIVAVGALLPDAPSAAVFWQNVLNKRYSITETPANRWSIANYYDPDPKAPDKTYSKIGGWVRDFQFDWKRFRLPPKVASSMDEGQQWAVTVAADVLADYGYPKRPLDTERTATIIGTAMGGELHYQTNTRIVFPEYANALAGVAEFQALPANTRQAILAGWHGQIDELIPPITEDSMPGELPNIVSGRVANMLNLRGPNFITDAACASSFAAVEAAVEMLTEHKVDAVIAGGVDRNMGIGSFVKFCKIGALSATGTRPFGDGADGFVMGEGTGLFLLKRLADAERDGDTIYAVIRGVGGASDGKGKGITAPNPVGQQLAIARAWENAGLDPATATMVEAHGTSTRVGDVVEVESLASIFGEAKRGSIGLGSAKSNIGHLKAGAGAAGMLKATMALHHKILPPTLNANPANPNIDFSQTPFTLLHEARNWEKPNNTPRRCGVSAYGFGGTNFHIVLEEYVPGMLAQERKQFAVADKETRRQGDKVNGSQSVTLSPGHPVTLSPKPPRGILALGANDLAGLSQQLDATLQKVESGWMPEIGVPETAVLHSPHRLIIDFGDHDELVGRLQKAQKVMGMDSAQAWKAMEAQGIFRGSGKPKGKMAFMFPGQGSQYVNMGRELVEFSPLVKQVFDEADAVMKPILGKPLTDYIFVDPNDPNAINQATFDLMQTEITQPAMLTMDIAILKLLQSYGFEPDMVMGHSLGEYAALIAAGIMPFAHALEASAARGAEMAAVDVPDKGKMAAVLAPYEDVEAVLSSVNGYVVPANINSRAQCVFGGASEAVDEAVKQFEAKGFRVMTLPVSHAFHTSIVAPASEPLRRVLDRLDIRPPQIPLVANVTGDVYPTEVEAIKDLLKLQIASPVQWVKGLETLYAHDVRAFVEVGPKRALRGFANDVFADKDDVIALMTNHPKNGTLASFNQALCGLYAAGFGGERLSVNGNPYSVNSNQYEEGKVDAMAPQMNSNGLANAEAIQQLVAQAVQNLQSPISNPSTSSGQVLQSPVAKRPYHRHQEPLGSVVISGTGLGLPGAEKPVMDPGNALRILHGEQFVDLIPERFRRKMVGKQITRLVKAADGSGSFATIDDQNEVIRLAGRGGSFDLAEEYDVPQKLVDSLDITTQLAMAAGLDALREAGIPLAMTYKKTSTGSTLPQKWMLPEALRDETGVIFASAFPGGDRFAEDFAQFYTYQSRLEQLDMLEELRRTANDQATLLEITRRINNLREQLAHEPYVFDRRFIFRILAMGHSQFAEYIGARGPNTQVNAACASTTQALAMAEDWVRNGRCRRVIVIAADDVTGEHLMEWVGAGFLALGAAATDDRVEEAALPFDKRRHGTILGMGACALVVESEDAVQERGMRGIVELLSTETRNSAFHGSRLDVDHISLVMNDLLTNAERRYGLNRYAIAPQLVFMSHETFTPARGGSAAAEVTALRENFGEAAKEIVVANTKGFTGHPMGVGIEDVIALKILEHGIVPPVPNYKEVDPDLGQLNLSRGGRYPVQYSLHLAAGFGSQIAFSLTRRIPGGPNRIESQPRYQQWLDAISGYDYAELEVVKRNLRIVAKGSPGRPPAPSSWQYGTEPMVRTQIGQGTFGVAVQPTPMRMPEPIVRKPEPVAPAPVKTEPKPEPVKPVELKVETAVPEPTPPPAEPISNPSTSSGQGPQSPVSDTITDQVLAIIAEQTGYPSDMLEPDLDLEADLGIDTVKQAETFVAIRQAFDIPRRDDLNLRDYNTLAKVVGFVKEMRPDLDKVTGRQGDKVTEPATESISNLQSPISDSDEVMDKVLNIIAEQTGYPVDMLEPDLDLEADLGIDTVKQAETFVAIRQAFDIPRRDDLNLRDYNTLARVVGFVREMRPDLKAQSRLQGDTVTGGQGDTVTEDVAEPISSLQSPVSTPQTAVSPYTIEDADSFPRRVATAVLRPTLDQCVPTGVVLDATSRVVVALDDGGVGKALVKKLEKMNATVLPLDAALPQAELEAQLQTWLADGPIQGVYWLPALDVEADLLTMDLAAWREANRVRVKNLSITMRVLYDVVNEAGNFLVSATRLGGLHGYGPEGATAPLGGGVTGFTKAYRHERPSVLVKAVDFELSRKTAVLADQLIAETTTDPGVVEVGYNGGLRTAVTLIEQPAADGQPGLTLNKESVFVVTGAAGGITSAIVSDLAASSGGIFYLLDLVEAPAPDDPHIALFRRDKDALKAQLIAEAKAAGEKPTPVLIDKKLMAIERSDAALRAIEAVTAAGGLPLYHSVNLLDGGAVTAVVQEIQQKQGKIDVLVHAGGIEISRGLDKKDAAQFDLVYDIKADGFFSLLRAAGEMPIGATVVFSSVAGRFGNNGQTDYSAANDLLCKLTSSFRTTRPGTKGIAIDWTAWGGIGMATRGSIPKIMEMAGIEMLPPEVGVPTVRRELVAGGFKGEILAGGKLGILVEERHPTGGLDLAKVNANDWLMVGDMTAYKLYGGLQAETVLDPNQQPFLYDHAMDGTPLLPGVMGTETFAELASLVAPGYAVVAVENEDFHAPFKFYRMEPQTLILVAVAVPAGQEILVHTQLLSRRELKTGVQEKLHFTATVRLAAKMPKAKKLKFTAPKAEEMGIAAEDIYKIYFHGPAYQVLARVQVDGNQAIGLLAENLPANAHPANAPELIAPRLVEFCFQTAGVWEIHTKQQMALPLAIGRVSAYKQEAEAKGRLYAIVEAIDDGAAFKAQVVDKSGNVFVELDGYRTVRLPGEVSL
ncbi:MAG: SDR family NAD(P)-dependent oxidoreductase [Chloroflexota bacterium]